MDFIENFNCPLWSERIQEPEPKEEKKVNALVILKCGRDIPVYLSEEALKDMQDQLEYNDCLKLDGAFVKCSEVAAIQFLEDVV